MKTFGKLLIAIMLSYAAYLVAAFIGGGMSAVLIRSAETGRWLLPLLPSIAVLGLVASIYFGIKRNNQKRKP
jgi:formate-dependent nitrite reductase membrane component NrfD